MRLRWPAPLMGPSLAAAAVLVAGAAVSLWLNLPGHFSYDSVVQLAEGRAGLYTGEHPPVMSWLLGVADRLAPGAAPFVAFDILLIFGALTAFVLIRRPASWLAAPLALACAGLPQLWLYPGIVWKDVLFAGASAAGFACLAWAAAVWRRARLRGGLVAAALALLSLAALSRQNGALVLPFAALALALIGARAVETRRLRRALATGGGFLAAGAALCVAASAALATRLELPGAADQAWTALQAYDLTAAIVREPGLRLDLLKARAPKAEALIRTQGVATYSPVQVDSIEPMLERLDPAAAPTIAAQWRQLIWRHPLSYLRVRATAFRWVFMTPDPAACVLAFTGVDGPPDEMAASGLAPRKNAVDNALDAYAAAFAPTPAYSHAAYAAVGLILLVLLLRRREAPDLAVAAMLGSAYAFAASFAVISLACDYRYLYDLDLAVIAAALYLAAGSRHMLHIGGASARALCSESTLKP